MKKYILIIIAFIIGFGVAWLLNKDKVQAQLACPTCPNCQITAQKIMSDSGLDFSDQEVTKIKLPDTNLQIEIGDKIYTKPTLKEIK